MNIGETANQTFTIRNAGGGMLEGEVTEGCTEFTLLGATEYSLEAGESATFTVVMAPATVGSKNCTIETGRSLCADVSCTGTGGPTPACQVTPTSLTFGTVNVGQTVERTFTIENTGGGTLEGEVTESCPDLEIAGDGIYSLDAGQSTTFTAIMASNWAGSKNCTIDTENALCADVSCFGTGYGAR